MIYINDKLRISKIDDNCLQLEAYKKTVSKKTKETTMKWLWTGYYGDVRSACIGAFRKQLFDTVDEKMALADIAKQIKLAEENIKKIVPRLKDLPQ